MPASSSWRPAVLLSTAAALTASMLRTCTITGARSRQGAPAAVPIYSAVSLDHDWVWVTLSCCYSILGAAFSGNHLLEQVPARSRRSAGPTTSRRVLVTGCNGSIGRPVCAWLKRAGHFVRGFDVTHHPLAAEGCNEFVKGDICDAGAVGKAMLGIDVLIHLAAFPDIKDAHGNAVGFVDKLLMPNVAGLYVCVEAALQAGVARVVLASSVQVITGLTSSADVDVRPKPNLPAVGGTDLFFTESDGVAPLHEYALTKVWAEQLGEFYARVHGLSIILARIGWFVRNKSEAEAMWLAESGKLDGLEAGSGFSVYLSHDDAGRFYQACVESTPTKGECITTFVTSRQPTARCELSA
eukprot:COSAG02_NODE_1113_length_14503_cov_87.812205_15_plen_354_part_00